jgi:hypothetical protein
MQFENLKMRGFENLKMRRKLKGERGKGNLKNLSGHISTSANLPIAIGTHQHIKYQHIKSITQIQIHVHRQMVAIAT